MKRMLLSKITDDTLGKFTRCMIILWLRVCLRSKLCVYFFLRCGIGRKEDELDEVSDLQTAISKLDDEKMQLLALNKSLKDEMKVLEEKLITQKVVIFMYVFICYFIPSFSVK